MRAVTLLAGALLAVTSAAQAADLPVEGGAGLHYSALGRRVAPLVIYDYEPGVVIRAYWIAPWRNRHYFPSNGEAPTVGRDEDLSAGAVPPEPAESYAREWTNAPTLLHRVPLPERPLK
jgi:hypothetical protein